MCLQEWSQRIKDPVRQRQNQNIPVWERQFDQMGSDHLANGVCVDKTGKENKGNQMFMEDQRVESKVRRNESPSREERNESKQGATGFVSSFSAGLDNIQCTFQLLVCRLSTMDCSKYLETVLNARTNPPWTMYHSPNDI